MSELAPGPDRVRPPGTVRISSYLLYATAAIEVISLLVTLATLSDLRQGLNDAYAGTTLEDAGDTAAVVVAVAGGVIALIIAIGLVVLGFLNLRGKNAARIVTWIVGGLFVLCCGIGSLLGAAGGGMNFDSGADAPDAADVQSKIDAAMPSWHGPVNTVLSIIPILLVLGTLILLALPASNAWFKPKAATWEPPTPGYPVMPGSSYPTPPYPQGEPPLPPAPPAAGSEPPETPAPPR
ncbi:hypothetical protein DFJ67_2469 [Asanoa ferruginea]|uniref:Uncharacterized protein n=1 Tax=Asanoa ferruginea TaxID=53367 RepID=A0A3D9ZGU7_9ACTN|nr:hypothetical protein [Asanoa ferruginea]REF96487.1 hypothetical protein DFJ67_2469 [Asanoa ferruginea]GIF50386.1 hypothetical protein Afe04nite_49250 [Asanoa ferruginea]